MKDRQVVVITVHPNNMATVLFPDGLKWLCENRKKAEKLAKNKNYDYVIQWEIKGIA